MIVYVAGSTPNGIAVALDRLHAAGPILELHHIDEGTAAAVADAWARGRNVRAFPHPAYDGIHGDAAPGIRDREVFARHRVDVVVVSGDGEGIERRAGEADVRVERAA